MPPDDHRSATDPAVPSYRHRVLLTAHILTAVGWLGCGLAVTVLTAAGAAGADPATVGTDTS